MRWRSSTWTVLLVALNLLILAKGIEASGTQADGIKRNSTKRRTKKFTKTTHAPEETTPTEDFAFETWMIVAIAGFVLVLVAGIAIGCFCRTRRKRAAMHRYGGHGTGRTRRGTGTRTGARTSNQYASNLYDTQFDPTTGTGYKMVARMDSRYQSKAPYHRMVTDGNRAYATAGVGTSFDSRDRRSKSRKPSAYTAKYPHQTATTSYGATRSPTQATYASEIRPPMAYGSSKSGNRTKPDRKATTEQYDVFQLSKQRSLISRIFGRTRFAVDHEEARTAKCDAFVSGLRNRGVRISSISGPRCDADAFAVELRRYEIESATIPVVFLLDSSGGDGREAFAYTSVIETSTVPVYGVILREAESAAALIFVSCRKRFMFPHARILFHKCRRDPKDNTEDELERALDDARAMNQLMKAYISRIVQFRFNKHANRNYNVGDLIQEKSVSLNPEKAVEIGVSTSVISADQFLAVCEECSLPRSALPQNNIQSIPSLPDKPGIVSPDR